MKVAVDTNVLVRAVVCDDPVQAEVAAALLTNAELVAVALPCLCEFVWVLLRVYGFQQADAARAIRALLAAANAEPRGSCIPAAQDRCAFSALSRNHHKSCRLQVRVSLQ